MMEPGSTPKTKTSGAAIASLICGLLGCIPFVTGLAAFILGIVGIRKTGNPLVKGRGLAIAGLILGVISLGGWGVFGLGAAALYIANQAAEPARVVAEEFTRDLSEGKIDEALALSAEGTDRAALEAAATKLKPSGTLTSVGLIAAATEISNGKTETTLTGLLTFSNPPQKLYSIKLIKTGDSFKVTKFDWP